MSTRGNHPGVPALGLLLATGTANPLVPPGLAILTASARRSFVFVYHKMDAEDEIISQLLKLGCHRRDC